MSTIASVMFLLCFFFYFICCHFIESIDAKILKNDSEKNGLKERKIWALLVAGSSGWYNYRHQADVCHAYHTLIQHGISPENIITMMYDDIAFNSYNPHMGKIYNHPHGPNVYANVPKDYTGRNVTAGNFLQILSGNASAVENVGSGRVIDSGPDDNIFVYFADHGASNLLAFPEDELYKIDLITTLNKMHAENRYNQLLFYVEACESGSMFEYSLRIDINVYALTAANGVESSWGCYCENDLIGDNCLGDVFSVKWLEDSDKENLLWETVHEQYQVVRFETNTSHVQQYGDYSIGRERLATFQGHDAPRQTGLRFGIELPKVKNVAPWPSRDIPLLSLKSQLEKATTKGEKLFVEMKIEAMQQKRNYLESKVIQIVKSLVEDSSANDLSARQLMLSSAVPKMTDLNCHKDVTREFGRLCFPFSQNPYALKYVSVLANLCQTSRNLNAAAILVKIQEICQNDPKLPYAKSGVGIQ